MALHEQAEAHSPIFDCSPVHLQGLDDCQTGAVLLEMLAHLFCQHGASRFVPTRSLYYFANGGGCPAQEGARRPHRGAISGRTRGGSPCVCAAGVPNVCPPPRPKPHPLDAPVSRGAACEVSRRTSFWLRPLGT